MLLLARLKLAVQAVVVGGVDDLVSGAQAALRAVEVVEEQGQAVLLPHGRADVLRELGQVVEDLLVLVDLDPDLAAVVIVVVFFRDGDSMDQICGLGSSFGSLVTQRGVLAQLGPDAWLDAFVEVPCILMVDFRGHAFLHVLLGDLLSQVAVLRYIQFCSFIALRKG